MKIEETAFLPLTIPSMEKWIKGKKMSKEHPWEGFGSSSLFLAKLQSETNFSQGSCASEGVWMISRKGYVMQFDAASLNRLK